MNYERRDFGYAMLSLDTCSLFAVDNPLASISLLYLHFNIYKTILSKLI